MKKSAKTIVKIISLLAGLALLASCGKDDNPEALNALFKDLPQQEQSE